MSDQIPLLLENLFCNPALGCCPLVVHKIIIIIIIIIAPFINVIKNNMNKSKNDFQGYNDRNYYISQLLKCLTDCGNNWQI